MTVTAKKVKRIGRSATRVSLEGMTRKCGCLFLDSGAHTIYTLAVIAKGHSEGYDFYKSKEFVKYVDEYAEFLKVNKDGMDFYANVDVIFNPKMSWQVQKYLEDKHGLNPIPVIHYGTELKWIEKHLDAGYKFLGIGGLGQEATANAYMLWADRLYEMLCDSPDKLPCVKTHGFAMTSWKLMLRYPWYSVDSASWAKAAGFGNIFVPHKRDGKFTFEVAPYVIGFSHRSSFKGKDGKHYHSLKPAEKRVVIEWLDEIGMSLGKMDGDNSVEYGVKSEYNARAVANLKFFEALCKWLPEWPWAFTRQPRKGFLSWEKIR